MQLRGDATDPAAEFDRFYAASVAAVTRQLFALTGDRAEAEDVVAEAFERAWLRLPVAQVAAETGASVSAVEQQLVRGRAALAVSLADERLVAGFPGTERAGGEEQP